jgi:hypothetical protein
MLYFRRPPLFLTVHRVPSEIALFSTAHGQPSEIRLFPMAHQPPVGNRGISDDWPPRPSEIMGGPLTVVTPRGPPAAHTANAHTFYTPRRRCQDPTPPSPATCAGPSPATCAGPSPATFAGHLRRTCPDRRTLLDVPRRPSSRPHSTPTPTPAQHAAAPTPAHLPRRPHSAPPPPPLEPPAPGFARRRRPGLARAAAVRVMASLSCCFMIC